MQKYFISAAAALMFWGCSSSVDTVNLNADERLKFALELYNEEDYQEALNELQAIVLQYPGSEVVDDAQYYLAMSRFKREEFILAAYEFSKLLKNYPASDFLDEAQFMLADCYYNLSPNFQLDQQYTEKGIEEFQVFLDFFPTDTKVPEAENKIAELNSKLARKEFNTALIYEKLDYYTAALKYYENVLEIYHDSQFAPQASLNKIKLLIDRKREREALAEVLRFLQRYPESSYYSEVERIKVSLESAGG